MSVQKQPPIPRMVDQLYVSSDKEGDDKTLKIVNDTGSPLSEFDIQNLPSTIKTILVGKLRSAEFKNLIEVFPDFAGCIDSEAKLLEKYFVQKNSFTWTRYLGHGISLTDDMAARKSHAMAYLPSEHAVYMFGGEAIIPIPHKFIPDDPNMLYTLPEDDLPIEAAKFNDMWKLDMATMKWSRVVVTSTPYPLAKFRATLLAYKDKLILFGGKQSRFNSHNGINLPFMCNEMHQFDTKTCQWSEMTNFSNENGPQVVDPAICVYEDWLILFGGKLDYYTLNGRFYLYNIKNGTWTDAPADLPWTVSYSEFDTEHNEKWLPIYRECQMFVVKPGVLLLVGETISRKINYVCEIFFNPKNITEEPWTWRKIPTVGRWWHMNPKYRNTPRDEQALLNKFPRVQMLRSSSHIRLVAIGIADKGRQREDIVNSHDRYCSLKTMYYKAKQRTDRFIRFVQREIHQEICHRYDLYRKGVTNTNRDAILKMNGITCEIRNIFFPGSYMSPELRKRRRENQSIRNRILQDLKVTITLDEYSKHQAEGPLDSVDIFRLQSRIKLVLADLYESIINGKSVVDFSSPSFAQSKGVAVYTADIDLRLDKDDPMEHIETLEWKCHKIRPFAPSETLKNFGFVACDNELVIHGGSYNLDTTRRAMSHTYLLTPVSPGFQTPLEVIRQKYLSNVRDPLTAMYQLLCSDPGIPRTSGVRAHDRLCDAS